MTYPIIVKDIQQTTPGKRPLTVPTQALAEAIITEWTTHKKFKPDSMQLSALAFTAIDRIAGQEASIVEALLTYLDTDTLCYRASNAAVLERQKKEWDPVLAWAGSKFNALWQTTTGVMPLEQPKALHEAISEYLSALDSMKLAALCILSSGYSSLALAIAVMEKHLTAEQAFMLSRLEEETQAEQWGRDEEADARALRMKGEINEAGRFLRLLEAE